MEPKEWYLRWQGLTTGPYPSHDVADWVGRNWLAGEAELFDLKSRAWRRIDSVGQFRDHLKPKAQLQDRISLEPLRYVEPPVRQPISWREKRKSARTELAEKARAEAIESALTKYTPDVPAPEPRILAARERPKLNDFLRSPSAALEEKPSSAASPPATKSESPLPERPEALEQATARSGAGAGVGASRERPSGARDPEILALFDDVLRYERRKIERLTPADSAKKIKMETPERPEAIARESAQLLAFQKLQQEFDTSEKTYQEKSQRESRLQRGIFVALVLLGLSFSVISLWLSSSRNLEFTWSLRTSPKAATTTEAAPETAPEAAPAAAINISPEPLPAPAVEIIRDGEITTRTSAGTRAEPNPSGSLPKLKAPVRPKRD